MSNTATELEKMIFDGRAILIEASKLSLDDKLMKYKPKTYEEKLFRMLLSEAIKSGLKDFYRPIMDPSFNDDMTGICYECGKRPAVGKSYIWWDKTAKEFGNGSRLGTKYEYVAFLGVLIKKLIDKGWSATKAWYTVCADSKELGHYCNSNNAKHNFESTGSREASGLYDLANTYKILAEDEDGGFWLAGGNFYFSGNYSPLADIGYEDERYKDENYGVGWIVFDCSD